MNIDEYMADNMAFDEATPAELVERANVAMEKLGFVLVDAMVDQTWEEIPSPSLLQRFKAWWKRWK